MRAGTARGTSWDATERERQQYATGDGIASTSRCAEMVREDRRLQLAGYEVYRFGGSEFATAAAGGQAMLEAFFTRLLDDPPTGL